MDKYRRVEKSKAHDAAPAEANEIRITQQGNVRSYISYANGLFADKNERGVVLKAMGNAISKAVTVAEILKHRVEHLHQITQISSVETVDVYEPLEEGLDRIETKRHIPSITIQLSLDALDKDDPGYQSPIPVELVSKGFEDKEPRKPAASARRKKKKSKAATAAASSGSSPVDDDDDDDDDAAAGQASAKTAPPAPAPASAAASSPTNDDGSESPSVKDGKPAARGDAATKRGRARGGRAGGRGGAGRKPRDHSNKVGEAGGGEGENAGASDEAKPAASMAPSDPSTSKKASRPRKPRAKPDESNGEASANAATSSPDQARHGDGEEGGRTSSFRGRGRGRGGRGRGRGRGRGGRGDAVSASDTPATTGAAQ